MKLFIKNVKDLVLPKKANENDAMFDVVATSDPVIVGTKVDRPIDGMPMWNRVVYVEYGTNLFIAPETLEIENYGGLDGGEALPSTFLNYHLKFYSRSSISKYNLVLANCVGTIDNGYRAQIFLRYKYIFAPEDLLVVPEAGITKIYGVVNAEDSQRGIGGFGSSGN